MTLLRVERAVATPASSLGNVSRPLEGGTSLTVNRNSAGIPERSKGRVSRSRASASWVRIPLPALLNRSDSNYNSKLIIIETLPTDVSGCMVQLVRTLDFESSSPGSNPGTTLPLVHTQQSKPQIKKTIFFTTGFESRGPQ